MTEPLVPPAVFGSRNSRVALVAFKKHWWVVLGGVAGAVLLAMVYLNVADPVYEADVRVLVQQRVLDLNPDAYRRQETEFITTQAEVIRSPITISTALETVPLTSEEGQSDDPLAVILESLRVNPLAGTDILKVTYSHSDPELAAARLKAMIQAYQNRIRERERNTSSNLVALLSERETELRQQIKAVQQDYSKLREKSPLVGKPHDGVTVETDRLRDLTNQLSEVQSRKLRWESLWKGIAQRSANGDAATDAVLPITAGMEEFRYLREIEQELGRARAEFRRIQAIYKERHQEFIAAKSAVNALESEFAEKKQLAVQTIRQQFDNVVQEEDQLQELFGQERERVKAMDEYVLKESQIQAELARLEQVYETTAQTLENLNLTDAALANGRASIAVEVLDRFSIPEEPIWPQPSALLTLAVAMGLGIGGLAAVLLALREGIPAIPLAESAVDDADHQALKNRVDELTTMVQDVHPVSRVESTSASAAELE